MKPVLLKNGRLLDPSSNLDERGDLLITGGRIEFDYKGIYKEVVDTVTPADVVWTCRLMSRLSDQQWNDAFAAGGYPPVSCGNARECVAD